MTYVLYIQRNDLKLNAVLKCNIVIFSARSEVKLQEVQVEQSEASSVSFSLDDDPEGLEDSTWSYDTSIKDLDDFIGQVPGSKQADKEIR